MQLDAAIIVEIVTFFINSQQSFCRFTACVVTSTLLQYSVILQFMWMLILCIDFNRNFKTNKLTGSDNRLIITMSAVGWIVPVIPVAFTTWLGIDSFNPDDVNYGFCFPSKEFQWFGFVGIIFGIFVSIVVFYVLIGIKFFKTHKMQKKLFETNCAERLKRRKTSIKLMTVLFFAAGIPWFFGALHVIMSTDQYINVGTILFCTVVPAQGLIVSTIRWIFRDKTKKRK